MRWFKRTPKAEPEATDDEAPIDWAARRHQPLACAGCKQANPPYVYAENGKDYCLDCAKTNFVVLRLRPAGKRDEDISLDELLADERAS